eukprot:6212318-Pleurochrysis_carterae.AAC.1
MSYLLYMVILLIVFKLAYKEDGMTGGKCIWHSRRKGAWHDYDTQAAEIEDGEGRIEKREDIKTPEMGASGSLRPTQVP